MDLRICVVASYFYPQGYGGNAVYELCGQLVKRGLEVHVVTSRLKGEPNYQLLDGIYVHRISTHFLRLFNTEYPISPTALTELSCVVGRYSDIIHANFEIFQTTFVASLVKRLQMKPMVLTMHGQGRTGSSSYGTLMLDFGYFVNHNSIERVTVRSADKIIALTKAVKAKALRLGADSDKISVIPNGVNTERFVPFKPPCTLYEELKIPRKSLVVTFVGRLHPTHGTELLMNAIPKIVKVYPSSVFVLAGDGPLRSKVEKFVEVHGLEHYVRLLGYRTDIPALLNIANVVVYPALSVGMPLTILEAMACEKAVIAFDIEGNRELITNGETGFLTEEINADALASCTISALSDLDYADKIGRNARSIVESNFTWQKTSEKVVDIYKNLLAISQ
jgi:glycosyltransferase involved in cell wall biosynthesis